MTYCMLRCDVPITGIPGYESKVDVAYIYGRLHDALNSDDLALAISKLSDEMSRNFESDTGTKIGAALGWNKRPTGYPYTPDWEDEWLRRSKLCDRS